MADDLKRLVSVSGGNLKVVFVSACYSAKTGQAFIEAGVPHVVCSRTDEIRDTAAVEFSGNFYRALACQISLKDSFYMAREAVRVSSDIINADLEANKFLLLPEKPIDDPYHDVKVFYQEAVPPYSGGPSFNKNQTNRVPRLPELFVGRELAIFDILECLNDSDVIQLEGEDGCGRSTAQLGCADTCSNVLNHFRTISLVGSPVERMYRPFKIVYTMTWMLSFVTLHKKIKIWTMINVGGD
jgi:hypothetical protein